MPGSTSSSSSSSSEELPSDGYWLRESASLEAVREDAADALAQPKVSSSSSSEPVPREVLRSLSEHRGEYLEIEVPALIGGAISPADIKYGR